MQQNKHIGSIKKYWLGDEMKVVQINKLYFPWLGGVETVVKQIAEGIAKKSIESCVIAVNGQNSKRTSTLKLNKVTVIKSKLNFFFGAQPISFSFFKVLKKNKADIIHLHLPNPFGVLCYLISKPKGKLLITYHSDIVKQRVLKFFYKPLLNIILKKADKIVATSQNLVNSSLILTKYKEKIVIIPLGINSKDYDIDENILLKIKKKYGENFLLAIGRLVEYKGFEYLLKALPEVPDKKLYIIGDGKLKNHLNEIIKEKNLTDRVTILKPLPFENLKAIMKLAKMFIFPSISNNEAFGIVQLEAMYFENPVVSSDLPTGVTFVNQHERTGLVTRKRDSESIAAAINKLLNEPELCRTIAENNPEYVRANFSEESMVDSYLKLYNEMLSEFSKT